MQYPKWCRSVLLLNLQPFKTMSLTDSVIKVTCLKRRCLAFDQNLVFFCYKHHHFKYSRQAQCFFLQEEEELDPFRCGDLFMNNRLTSGDSQKGFLFLYFIIIIIIIFFIFLQFNEART